MSTTEIAYGFKLQMTWTELLSALQSHSPWKWHERQTANADDYFSAIAARGDEWSVGVSIFAEHDETYTARVRLRDLADDSPRGEGQHAYAEAEKLLLERVLPALGAESVVQAEAPESVQPFEI